MKKILSLLIIGTLIFSFVGCNKKDEVIKGDDVQDSDTSVTTPQQDMPEYDYKNLEASDKLDLEPKTSYYVSSYDEKEKLVFDELCQKISDCESEINITRNLTQEQLKQMMNVMLIDMPEYFNLASSYSYSLDTNDNVSKVYPTYTMNKEDYKKALEEFDSNATNTLNSLKEKTQYDAEIEIVKKIINANLSTTLTPTEKTYSFEEYAFSGNSATTLFGNLLYRYNNSISMSKLFTYYCRKLGLEASCVIGEITDNALKATYGGDYKAFKTPEKAITISKNGSKTTVSVDYDSFYCWNIIKINNNWYHTDLYYQSVLDTYLNDTYSDFTDTLYSFINMPDAFASNSRLYYYNESVLGMLPSCTSQVFQYSYRNGAYFPDYNSSQMAVAINSLITSITSSETKSFALQMANQKTYDLFLDNFDKLLSQYNENNKQLVRNYEIVENKASYSIIVLNINYN